MARTIRPQRYSDGLSLTEHAAIDHGNAPYVESFAGSDIETQWSNAVASGERALQFKSGESYTVGSALVLPAWLDLNLNRTILTAGADGIAVLDLDSEPVDNDWQLNIHTGKIKLGTRKRCIALRLGRAINAGGGPSASKTHGDITVKDLDIWGNSSFPGASTPGDNNVGVQLNTVQFCTLYNVKSYQVEVHFWNRNDEDGVNERRGANSNVFFRCRANDGYVGFLFENNHDFAANHDNRLIEPTILNQRTAAIAGFSAGFQLRGRAYINGGNMEGIATDGSDSKSFSPLDGSTDLRSVKLAKVHLDKFMLFVDGRFEDVSSSDSKGIRMEDHAHFELNGSWFSSPALQTSYLETWDGGEILMNAGQTLFGGCFDGVTRWPPRISVQNNSYDVHSPEAALNKAHILVARDMEIPSDVDDSSHMLDLGKVVGGSSSDRSVPLWDSVNGSATIESGTYSDSIFGTVKRITLPTGAGSATSNWAGWDSEILDATNRLASNSFVSHYVLHSMLVLNYTAEPVCVQFALHHSSAQVARFWINPYHPTVGPGFRDVWGIWGPATTLPSLRIYKTNVTSNPVTLGFGRFYITTGRTQFLYYDQWNVQKLCARMEKRIRSKT
jgi:hypothetical protein